MNTRFFTFSLVIFAVAACSQVPQTVEVPKTVIVKETVIIPQTVPVTKEIEVTRIVTSTVEPTVAASTSTDKFALNYVSKIESGQVTIEIARVVCGTKTAIGQNFDQFTVFQDLNVVCLLVLKISNAAQQALAVYPDQGQVVIGTEQIDVFSYALGSSFGDHLGGEVQPGVIKIGGFWFGVKRSTVDQIQSMKYIVHGPATSSLQSAGDDYTFELDLSNHEFQPVPDELK